jgi:hypothetical protein
MPKEELLETPKEELLETPKEELLDMPKEELLDMPKEELLDMVGLLELLLGVELEEDTSLLHFTLDGSPSKTPSAVQANISMAMRKAKK